MADDLRSGPGLRLVSNRPTLNSRALIALLSALDIGSER